MGQSIWNEITKQTSVRKWPWMKTFRVLDSWSAGNPWFISSELSIAVEFVSFLAIIHNSLNAWTLNRPSKSIAYMDVVCVCVLLCTGTSIAKSKCEFFVLIRSIYRVKSFKNKALAIFFVSYSTFFGHCYCSEPYIHLVKYKRHRNVFSLMKTPKPLFQCSTCAIFTEYSSSVWFSMSHSAHSNGIHLAWFWFIPHCFHIIFVKGSPQFITQSVYSCAGNTCKWFGCVCVFLNKQVKTCK